MGDSIETLPMGLEFDAPMTELIAKCLSSDADQQHKKLRRAYGPDGEQCATLTITPAAVHENGLPQVLIFVIDAHWVIAAPDLILYQYDLTKAETALLANFLEGMRVEQMALLRGRSVATVRTQFYSLMTKMKVSNKPIFCA